MKATSCLGLGAAAVLLLAGCSTPDVSGRASLASRDSVALGALGPMTPADGRADGAFYFGAGDAIGEEIFTYYVVSLRLDQYYATGGNLFPETE